MIINKSLILVLIAALLTVGLTRLESIAEDPDLTKDNEVNKPEKIKTLAILPLTSKADFTGEEQEQFISPEERLVTQTLYEALLTKVKGVEIVPLKEAEQEFMKLIDDNNLFYYKNTAATAGRSLGVDAVVVGYISVYREREGSDYGVEKPASVAFSIDLVSSKDGSTYWGTYFTETQKPLLQNVFEFKKFVKRGGKWITSDQLAVEGAREVAKRLNNYLLEN